MILLIERLTLSNHVKHCIQDPEIRMHDLKKNNCKPDIFCCCYFEQDQFLSLYQLCRNTAFMICKSR